MTWISGYAGCYDHVFLQWTAPGDDGPTGTAAQYDLRWANSPITEATFASATGIFTNVNSPLPAGSPESVYVSVPRCSNTRWYALKTRDAANNWSPVSNSIGLKPPCPTHGFCDEGGLHATHESAVPDAPTTLVLEAPYPSPGAGVPIILRYSVPPSLEGLPLDLAMYDLAGRRIATAVRGTGVAGHHLATWDLTDEDGRRVRTGIYFVQLRVGPNMVQRQVIITR
jgi:hypothetical protein